MKLAFLELFGSLTTLQKSLVVSILSIVLFITSAGVSYSIASSIAEPVGNGSLATSLPGPSQVVVEDPGEPKTESCPLNGAYHTKKARDNWEKRRPLAVMIENHSESRPQSGLSSADIIYEAVAEGGITRLTAIYLCNLADVQIGPIRSARTYFLDWLSPYDPLYAHVGGANTPGPADALGQIIKYRLKDLNQFSIGFPTFWRDYQRLGRPVATEHTMYSTTQKLWDIGAKRGWVVTDDKNIRWDVNLAPWKFKEPKEGGNDNLVSASNIEVSFWQNQTDYTVAWEYDNSCFCYKRKHSGQPHTDLNNKQSLVASNVIVQFQKEFSANDGYEGNVHLLYKTTGEGKALIFRDGLVIEGKWVKKSRIDREKFVDGKGKDVVLNKGLTWIQTVPDGAKVNH